MRRMANYAAKLLALVLMFGTPAIAAATDPSPARQKELLYRLRQDCGSCHGLTMKGGLGPSLLPTALASKPNDYLTDVILKGMPGTPMPPWAFEVSRDEAGWLVRRLKRGLAK